MHSVLPATRAIHLMEATKSFRDMVRFRDALRAGCVFLVGLTILLQCNAGREPRREGGNAYLWDWNCGLNTLLLHQICSVRREVGVQVAARACRIGKTRFPSSTSIENVCVERHGRTTAGFTRVQYRCVKSVGRLCMCTGRGLEGRAVSWNVSIRVWH